MRDKLEQEQAFLASLIADRAASSKTAAGRAGAGRAADARGSKTKEAAGDGVDGGAGEVGAGARAGAGAVVARSQGRVTSNWEEEEEE